MVSTCSISRFACAYGAFALSPPLHIPKLIHGETMRIIAYFLRVYAVISVMFVRLLKPYCPSCGPSQPQGSGRQWVNDVIVHASHYAPGFGVLLLQRLMRSVKGMGGKHILPVKNQPYP